MRCPSVAVALAALALAGCGQSVVAVDVPRFDPRDAVVDDAASGVDVPGRLDVLPSIDVTPAADAGLSSDAGASGDTYSACQEVSEDYATAVRAAQSCRVDGECGALVCETLCCACEVYVNASATEYVTLQLLRDRWTGLGCATMGRCAGGGGCGAAVAASCSAEGRCLTVHSQQPDAGADDASGADVATDRPAIADVASVDAAVR